MSVASAGDAQAVVGECVGEATADASLSGGGGGPLGFQGETSGQTDPAPPARAAGGSNYGCGENGGGSPMDAQASALVPSVGWPGGGAGPGAAAAAAPASHVASHAKRKISEMGEVDESPADAGGGDVGAGGAGARSLPLGQQPERRPAVDGGLDRVPSDLGMVLGDTDGAAFAPLGALPQAGDEGDSNAARPLLMAADGDAAVRPTDAEILNWEAQIKSAETANQPLIGELEPLASLEAEYASGSEVFLAKIRGLHASYGAIRRARGDGNCFFRSFLFGYLEGLLTSQGEAEKARMLSRLDELKTAFKTAGYDELVFESPLDIVLEMLRGVGSPVAPLTLAALESNLREDYLSNTCVFLLRLITSCEIKRRADFFAPFVMVPVRVVYLDRSTAPSATGGEEGLHADVHDFVPEARLLVWHSFVLTPLRHSLPHRHLSASQGVSGILYPTAT
eukprot:scaffold18.g1976.t1